MTRNCSVWSTDPEFDVLGYYEGEQADPEFLTHVHRIDGVTGAFTVATDAVAYPNGLAFSPDKQIAYIVECGSTARRLIAFDITADGQRLSNPRAFIDASHGTRAVSAVTWTAVYGAAGAWKRVWMA